MNKLLWFHAFARSSLEEILTVLREGASPPRIPLLTKTEVNEKALGITRNVYAYLGRSADCFGTNAVAFPLKTPNGVVSPFDTGGLVSHIHPVCEWAPEQRSEFLNDYTFSTTEIEDRLRSYPAQDGLDRYLDGGVPPLHGPHEVWDGVPADIWNDAQNEWQAWTWEVRSRVPFPGGSGLHSWTCPGPLFEQIQLRAEQSSDHTTLAWFEDLSSKFVPGGISQLIARFRQSRSVS